ncbi:hypothetical protein H310_13879 [Aphanomyces invadans]|uniref:Uncharacterized protein n=1 Tax=Aphanomyces invadans TaxID=157072 RepID=A0A024TDG3_9STRA|nr:hypothetical protein H310_13879 [Aphanomyces invadans]ETV91631.1 hypothetical protein H310_13879 [Aphanomyces invadans]|eukprot:XP_008879750.1 hypothetical protein H310_13879 [Aphanomyces invadans]
MTKVYSCQTNGGKDSGRASQDVDAAPPPRRFHSAYHRVSVLLNLALTMSLVSTPLMAYATEPFPWTIPARDNFTWTSFDTYTAVATSMLQALYNNHTMGPGVVCMRSVDSNSHAVRYSLTFPPSHELVDHPFDAFRALVSFPGSLFYGAGLRAFVYDFLAANDSMRSMGATWQRCHHVRLLGQAVGEACTWIEPPSTQAAQFTVYHGVVILETDVWSWVKLSYRSLLACYILRILWHQYYRHVTALHTQLQVVGLDDWPECASFHVVVGDPTGLVVSDPVVALVMVIDILSAPRTCRWPLFASASSTTCWCLFSGAFTRPATCGVGS